MRDSAFTWKVTGVMVRVVEVDGCEEELSKSWEECKKVVNMQLFYNKKKKSGSL